MTATLGANCSSNLIAGTGYAFFNAHLTRTTLTAKTSAGLTYIPTSGTWTISGGLSGPVTGQVISTPWWLPNGTYTGSLTGATMTGSSQFTIGQPITQAWQAIVTVSSPAKH